MVARRVWRGRLRALLCSGRRGAIAGGIIPLAPARRLLGAGWRDKRGSVAPMAALLGVALIGSAALAVDVSVWEGNIGTMQGAADQAALAAGLAMSAGNVAAQKEAKGVAAAHGFVDQTGSVAVTVNIPPASGSYASNTKAIEVVISQSQATFLSGVLPQLPPVASVRAVAVAAPASTCILMLAPTRTGINSGGTGVINTPTCNIYVNSASACDVYISGTGDITGYDVFLGEQSQAGCTPGTGRLAAKNKLQFGAAPALDPYGSRTMPTPSTPCKNINTSPKKINLVPGTYCGLKLDGTQSVNMSSGIYIFYGSGITLTGTNQIVGDNVTLVFTGSGSAYGGISLQGVATIDLTPMTTGDTAGMAIWLDKAGARPLTLPGVNTLNITGAIYAPSSAVSWSGTGSSPCTQLIASTMTISGTATFKHECSGLGVADVANAAGYMLLE